MRMRGLLGGLVCVGLLCASVVMAVEEGRAGKRKAAGAGKGAKERGQKHFQAADTDGSGSLSLEEFKAMREKRQAAMKEKLGEKFEKIAAKMPSAEDAFAKIDQDANGELSQEEMKAAHEVHRQRRAAGEKKGKAEGGRRGKGAGKKGKGTDEAPAAEI